VTVVETRPVAADPAPEVRRRTSLYTRADWGALAGSALSSLTLTWLIFGRLTLLDGSVGFAVAWAALWVATYWLVLRDTEDAVAARDKVMALVIGVSALFLIVPLMTIIGYVAARGLPGLSWRFFVDTLEFTGPQNPGGGLAHAIVGTLMQVGLAVLLSVPLGFLTAVFLVEVGGPLKRPVRMIVEAMSGVPSIVAGLFIYSVYLVQFGVRFNGFAAALALSILMLPTVTRTSEEVLRLVPGGLREASLALGAPQWRTVWSVVLPTARAGLITAVVLGIARAAGETAPLIVTAFGSRVMNWNPFDEAQGALPLAVFELIRSPQPEDIQRAWTAALVLILTVLLLFFLARSIGAGTRTIRGSRMLDRRSRRTTRKAPSA
jgi:phosphate transport system permease protein